MILVIPIVPYWYPISVPVNQYESPFSGILLTISLATYKISILSHRLGVMEIEPFPAKKVGTIVIP